MNCLTKTGLVATFLLSGCLSQSERDIRAVQSGVDTCGKVHLEHYVGSNYDNLEIRHILPEEYVFRTDDKRLGDNVLLSDFKVNRVTIRVDPLGKISALKCG